MAEWGIISTVLIVAVLALRRCCQGKIPHRLIYGLWLVVLVRLLVPVTPVESAFSILNYLPQWEKTSLDEDVDKGNDKATKNDQLEKNVYLTDELVRTSAEANVRDYGELRQEPVETAHFSTAYIPQKFSSEFSIDDENVSGNDTADAVEKNTLTRALIYRVWLAGVIALAVFFAAANLRFYIRVRKNAVLIGNYQKLRVYDTKEVVSPCLFGVIAPAVYLDGSRIASETAKEHILTHEATHYRHRDNLWAALRAVAVVLHWYNPLVWYAAFVSEKDCELACDESVIKTLGEENRISYGETLLQMICQSRRIGNVMCAATTMVGTKKGIKERIKWVAQKKHFSKAVFIVLAVCAFVVTACTFTGKESNAEEKALIKEAKEKLYENENYTKTMNLKTISADYDNDGEKECFLFVETGEESVDVLYYDEGEITVYRTENKFGDLDAGIDVMELAGKSFCVYDRVSDEKVTSRLLGIREGEIVDYFMDYQNIWLDEKNIDGKITAVNGTDVDVTTYNHVASIEGEYSKEQYCAMTEYFYYDKSKDSFRKYPVYEITREEFLAADGAKEALLEFEALFDSGTGVITYAKCNGKMILMGYDSYAKSFKIVRKHRVYAYEAKENRLGALLLSGEGMYENLDAASQQTVSRYEQNKMNAVYKMIDEYEETMTFDGRVLKFKEWWEEERAYIRICEWTEENEPLMHLIEIPFVYEDGVARLSEQEPAKKTYTQVTDLATFQMLYTEGNGANIDIPDLFLYNIQAELADNHIEKYLDAESAFRAYFPLEEGIIRDIAWGNHFGVETAKITYEFADKNIVTVELYKDYQGVWGVVESGFREGYNANVLYAQLTEDDFEYAVPADEFSFAADYGSQTGRNVLLKERIAPGADVYYSANELCGMIVKNGDETTLLPVSYDLMNLPQLFVGDYDNDGMVEALVINCIGRGTEYHAESVSVIESVNKPYDRVYELSTYNVEEMIDEKLQVIYNKENGRIRLELDTDNEASDMELSVGVLLAEMKNKGESSEMGTIRYGNIAYMTCDGGSILCDMLLSYVPDGCVSGLGLSEAHSGYDTVPWEGIRVKMHYEEHSIVFDDVFFITEEEFAYWR